MKPSRRVTAVAAALLIVSAAASVLLLRQVDRVRTGATLQEVLYISSPKAIKRLSLGYTGLVADIYWTRAVQYFGGKVHTGARHYELLGPLLEITTTLDPQLLVAYEYGSNFLGAPPPLGAGMPQQAIKLIQFGIQNNPDKWHLYYDLGFVYYLELKDYPAAAKAFEEGSKTPNAHPFMKLMAGNMAQHAGEYGMARMLWTATYESAAEKVIKANALAHLRAITVDQDVIALGDIVGLYAAKTGQLPQNFPAMIAAGYLRSVPLDPLGRPYKLMSDGRIEVTDPDHLPFIQKGLPPGYVPPEVVKLPPVD
jgi:tetratricopeptide (TPR) repeat protein